MTENKKEELELSKTAQDEKEILDFWNKEKIFEKSISQRDCKKEFVFYDGPPFATGSPHYGHLLAGTIKDVLPRYKTMKGFKVKRNWGWDCHGLPIENIIEKKFSLNSKEDIEKFGIVNFNKEARRSVLSDDQIWKKLIPKSGRWVDMSNPYKTMDSDYTESLWWAFSELNKKGLVKKDFKPMHICPRCETTLSNNEVSENYQNLKDLSVIAKFKLENESDTFILAWTTTPWTLPGNVALAVGGDIDYIKVKNNKNSEQYIFAKNLLEKIKEKFDGDFEILKEYKASDLIGKSYTPLFNYYSDDENLDNKNNSWKIYSADFVTTEAGTGIVHIAPAFGEDDLKLAKENDLAFIQHVGINGKFKKEVSDFSGMQVRKKEFHEEVDIEIIKFLAHNGKLFSKEKYEHSYPCCWRCDTPLLNYTTSSWFIDSPKVKDQLLATNEKINWIPEHVGKKRFHNWLKNTRPWAVSRSRYWGSPLPIWENKESGDYKILGSLEELKNKTRSKNNFILFRHGESEANVADILSHKIGKYGDSLTENGKNKAKENSLQVLEVLKKNQKNNNGEKIDLIISSPFIRTKETAEILKENLGVENEIIFDDRLQEHNFGEENFGKPNELLHNQMTDDSFTVNTKTLSGESFAETKKRCLEFMYEIDKKYSEKNILIVSHQVPTSVLLFSQKNKENKFFLDFDSIENIENSTPYFFDFAPIPCDENYEVNFHKPYIDKISFIENGKKYECIGEVFDCWFESGSMPFASKHYPFENTDIFNPEKNIGFPADFIAEGQDQTRGWFNTMLILSVALFGKSSYKNVIVNGIILAEDGKKMSKSLQNYPDPKFLFEKYGADAARFYMISSPAVRAESMQFSEKGVDEIMKKVVMKTKNILAFYELYKNTATENVQPKNSKNILDRWVLKKTEKLVLDVSESLDNYTLDLATRPIFDFIDDFSTWYIRRSRNRFKGLDLEDKNFALATTEEVLKTLSKILAPFTPFLAENLWQSLRNGDDKESVHLEKWPEIKNNWTEKFIKNNILKTMKSVKNIVSAGLESRTVAGLKVRQPLDSILVIGADSSITEDYQEIILDELNIKKIYFENDLKKVEEKNYSDFSEELLEVSKEKNQDYLVFLNRNISPKLQIEGNYREFLRQIQIMRKNNGLKVENKIDLSIDLLGNENTFIEDFTEDLQNTAGVQNINYHKIENDTLTKINKKEIKIELIKL